MHKMLIDIPDKLETDRLLMRPYDRGEGEMYYRMLRQNREHLKNTGSQRLLSIMSSEEAEIYIRELIAGWVSRERFVMGLWEKDGGFAGEVWIEPENWDGLVFEMGWFAECSHTGKGFIKEAVRGVLKFLFETLNAHKVLAIIGENNVRSFKLAESCGFIREGCLRQQKKLKDGTWRGTLFYGILLQDYETAKRD